MVFSAAAADPAPALTRGLALLRRLEADGSASLESLARRTGWPKSSVSRLLKSLVIDGAVRRDPATRLYHAAQRLVPLGDPDQAMRDAARPVLYRLAQSLNQTVELHRFEDESLIMIDRSEPENAAVSVNARIGFERSLFEVDALTQIALAFGLAPDRWPNGRYWAWHGGTRKPVSRTDLPGIIESVQGTHAATDLGINENSVRRYAAPIMRDGSLVAVLAIAQICPPTAVEPDPAFPAVLQHAADQLSQPHTITT